jgi:hypothetical protein
MNPEVCKAFATETKWESKLEELRSMQRKSALWFSADARGAVPDLRCSPNASPAGRVAFVSGAKSFGQHRQVGPRRLSRTCSSFASARRPQPQIGCFER